MDEQESLSHTKRRCKSQCLFPSADQDVIRVDPPASWGNAPQLSGAEGKSHFSRNHRSVARRWSSRQRRPRSGSHCRIINPSNPCAGDRRRKSEGNVRHLICDSRRLRNSLHADAFAQISSRTQRTVVHFLRMHYELMNSTLPIVQIFLALIEFKTHLQVHRVR
jgi:hypothetical protein